MSSRLWPSHDNGHQKLALIFVVGMIICWAVAGNAFEQWDATASARVNLRKAPSLAGAILSIIPNGRQVRIVQEKGLWCKVDVEGEIHGQGWVYARYLEKIPPEAPATDSPAQTARAGTATGEQKQEIHPIQPPPESGAKAAAVQSAGTPLPSKTLTTVVTVQSSARNELPNPQNESIALPQLKSLMRVEPVHTLPVQLPYASLKQNAPQISAKNPSKLIERNDSAVGPKRIPGEKKKLAGGIPDALPTVSEQPLSDPPGRVSPVIKSSVSQETQRLTFKRRPIGTVGIALKLVSLVLYGLVVLLLYKGN